MKKSLVGKKFGKSSTSISPVSVREYESCGFRITLRQQEISKRSATFDIAEEELGKIPTENIISQTPKPPAVFELEEPSCVVEAGQEEANTEAWKKYRAEKERFDAAHAGDKPMVSVTAWIPVRVNLQVLMDGQEVKIFHTLRGPVMGLVKNEDLHRAYLYSPCFIDPNIERGRVHYLPLAFAGFEFTLYKGGIGESIPQEAEIEGYPHFVERNRAGDYTFRMKAAYHHIEADYPEDAKLISADIEPRDALVGLLATSDTREQKVVDRARQVQEAQKQLAATEAVHIDEEPETPVSEPIPSAEEDGSSPLHRVPTREVDVPIAPE